MSRPTILVTGGNGQVGNELRVRARDFKKFNLLFIDREEVDLADSQAFNDFVEGKRFEYIINCAAYTAVDQAESDESYARLINAEVPAMLSNYCKENHTRFIHISTDYVFDGNNNRPLKETDSTNPISVYGKTKLEGEQAVMNTLQSSYVIRTSWLYSSFGKNFVKTMLKLATHKERLEVISDQIGTPTNGSDLANAILSIVDQIEKGNDNPGIYHYSNEGVTSWYDFAKVIFRLSKVKCEVMPIPSSQFVTAARRPVNSLLDKTKIKNQFNLTIPHWIDSLEKTILVLR